MKASQSASLPYETSLGGDSEPVMGRAAEGRATDGLIR